MSYLQGLTSVPVNVETEHTIPLMAFSNAKVFMGHMFIAVAQVVRVVTGWQTSNVQDFKVPSLNPGEKNLLHQNVTNVDRFFRTEFFFSLGAGTP